MKDEFAMKTKAKLPRMLLGLAAVILLLGLVYGLRKGPTRARNHIPRPVRMASSVLVLLAALLNARRHAGLQSGYAAAGMACGLTGDLILAELIPLPQHVIAGMLAFGTGHGFYLRACDQLGRLSPGLKQAGLGMGWLAALIGWWTLARNPKQPLVLNIAALGYALLLGSMAGKAGALALHDSRHLSLAVGGSLFLGSDLVLAGELFRELDFPGIGDFIWLSYISGQALIVDALGNEA